MTFQDDYTKKMQKLNAQNVDHTLLDYEKLQKKSDFELLFDDVDPSPRNGMKVTVVVICCIVVALSAFYAITSPTVKVALAQNVLNFYGDNAAPIIEDVIYDDDLSQRNDNSYASRVTIHNHGQQTTFDTPMYTVEEVLKEQNLKIGFGDGVYPTEKTVVGDNLDIYIDRVTSRHEEMLEDEDFTTDRSEDGTIRQGEEQILQEGVPGKVQYMAVIHEIAGHEVSRDKGSEITLIAPVNAIIKVGTYVPPPPQTVNAPMMAVPDTDVKQYALEQVRARGWDDSEFNCLVPLWQRESGWRAEAGNAISGAYGIPQALPGSKMASAGEDWRTNPMTQVRWGLGYVAGRYGTPCNAWNSWQTHHWY